MKKIRKPADKERKIEMNKKWIIIPLAILLLPILAEAGVRPIALYPNNETTPVVAYDESTENYLVVWRADNWTGCGSSQIIGRIFDKNGNAVTGYLHIAMAPANEWSPHCSAAEGTFIVVFNREYGYSGSGDYDIHAQLIDASTGIFGSFFNVAYTTNREENARVAYNEYANAFFVVWQSNSTAVQGRAIHRFATYMGPVSDIVHSNHDDCRPDVAADQTPGSNELMVTFVDYDYVLKADLVKAASVVLEPYLVFSFTPPFNVTGGYAGRIAGAAGNK